VITSTNGDQIILVPITLREARSFVDQYHRHHPAPQGGLFAIGVAYHLAIAGVAIVGKPVARNLADDWTAEVTRVCAHPRAPVGCCSKLYAACWRAARAMGYRRLVTYTLATERGVSVAAAGWSMVAQCQGGSWHRDSRPRVDRHPTQEKLRWEVVA
jgi:hypothetical protein